MFTIPWSSGYSLLYLGPKVKCVVMEFMNLYEYFILGVGEISESPHLSYRDIFISKKTIISNLLCFETFYLMRTGQLISAKTSLHMKGCIKKKQRFDIMLCSVEFLAKGPDE